MAKQYRHVSKKAKKAYKEKMKKERLKNSK